MNTNMNSFYKSEEEHTLLALLLAKPESFVEYRGKVYEELFYDSASLTVWRAMRAIEQEKKVPNLLLVNDYLLNLQTDISLTDWALNAGSRDYYFSSDIDSIIDILKKHEQKRRMIVLRNTIDAIIASPDIDTDIGQTSITSSYLKFLSQSSMTTDMDYADKTMSNLYEQIAEGNKFVGIPTGFNSLDEKIRGMKAGDLFVIGAQTSIGKTALALNITTNVAKQGKEVAYFSLEMKPEKLYLRIAATIMGVPANILADQNRWNGIVSSRIGEVFQSISKLPIRMPPSENYTIEKIVGLTRMSHSKKPIDLLVLDYLQIVRDPKGSANRPAFISDVCSELKALAMSLGIPIIVLAQVSRKSNEGKIHKPELWHLKESGSIEQAADVVLLIHRNKYGPESEGYDPELGNSHAQFRIVKNRDGECGDILVGYEPSLTLFCELGSNSGAA